MQPHNSTRPSNLEQLDAVLNARILSAPSDAEANGAWYQKIGIKQYFQNLSDEAIESASARILRELSAEAA